MSSASTSSLRNFGACRRPRAGLLGLARACARSSGIVPYCSSAARPRSASRCGALELDPRLLELLLQLGDRADRLLLALPLGVHRGRALALLGQRRARAARAARPCPDRRPRVERLQLDLQLHDVPVDLVDLGRLGVDLHPDPRGGLVDEVDRLVGQEAVGDVAVAEASPRRPAPSPGCGPCGGPRSAP